jgi:hypothetical protein
MDYTFFFASVTCLQGYIRGDHFVLGAQPLDMSLLSLCWYNKMLLPANCLKSPVSQLANSRNISWGLIIWDCGDGELLPPLSLGYVRPDSQEEIPPGANGQLDPEGDSSSWRVGVRTLDAQRAQ